MATKKYIKIALYIKKEQYDELKRILEEGNVSHWFRKIVDKFIKEEKENE